MISKSLELFDHTSNRTVKNWTGHEKDITKVYKTSFNQFKIIPFLN